MNILHISQNEELSMIDAQANEYVCLLNDECPCNASHFQNTGCKALAIVGRRVGSIRRGKHFVELELTQQYGCPVRLFKDESQAQQWLAKQLEALH